MRKSTLATINIKSNSDSDCPDSLERDNWFVIFLIFFV